MFISEDKRLFTSRLLSFGSWQSGDLMPL